MSQFTDSAGSKSLDQREHNTDASAKRVVPYYLDDDGDWVQVPVAGSSASSVTSVDDTASNTQLLAANTSRKEAVITNDSTSVLYVAFGETATTTNYTARLEQYGYVKTDYKGQINGIWASNSTGAARITELT